MRYSFVHCGRIEPYLKAIENRSEFIVAERDHFDIINYVVNMSDTFPDPMEPNISSEEKKRRILVRDCRGLAFDKSGDVLSKPYHKFFNANEREETLSHNLDFTSSHEVLEKLDGSMVRPLYIKEFDGFRLGTKMGITDTSMQAEVYVAEHVGYFRFFREMLVLGKTAIFEWCSLHNRIVIRYDEPSLRLTAVRDLVTGEYMSRSEMEDLASSFQIPIVSKTTPVESFDDFYRETRAIEDSEGHVIRFDTGHMVKVKADLYCRLHKSKEIASDDRKIYQLILDEEVDDIKPRLQEEDLAHVEELEAKFQEAVLVLSRRFEEVYEANKHLSPKEFALGPALSLDPTLARGFFSLKKGESSLKNALQMLRSNMGTRKKLDEFVQKEELDL